MTQRERYRAVFSRLHASADTLTEVQKMIQNEKQSRKKLRKRVLTLALAAALLLALGVTANAVGSFRMKVEPGNEENAVGTWPEDGMTVRFPEAGLVFSYEADAPVHEVEFCPGWLPGEPNVAWARDCIDTVPWQEGEWYQNLSQDASPDGRGRDGDLGIRYQISLAYAQPGFKLVLNGEGGVVKTDTWGDLSVTEAQLFWEERRGAENYVLLFSESEGYMVIVGGSDDLETLEHIARELQIRPTGETLEPREGGIGLINIGRG